MSDEPREWWVHKSNLYNHRSLDRTNVIHVREVINEN